MDVILTGSGANSSVPVQLDPTHHAVRQSPRPFDHLASYGVAAGGHYAVGFMTGTIAAAIASLAQVFQVRWADPSRLFIPYRLTVQFSTGTGFAATTVGAPVELIVGHGSTANGSGGSALGLNSVSNKIPICKTMTVLFCNRHMTVLPMNKLLNNKK